jgi:hypothetical protein
MDGSRRFALALVVLAACSPASSAPPVAGREAAPVDAGASARGPRDHASVEVAWYVGTTRTTSPDGATSYGPPKTVAVRRTLDPARGTIDEYVVHPGRELPTTLVRSAEPSTFDASDAARSFTGKIVFRGREWAWDAWTYEIAMSDGSGTLRGEGTRTADAITTTKTFFSSEGKPKARIVDQLERVDEKTFEAARAALLPKPGASAADGGAR